MVIFLNETRRWFATSFPIPTWKDHPNGSSQWINMCEMAKFFDEMRFMFGHLWMDEIHGHLFWMVDLERANCSLFGFRPKAMPQPSFPTLSKQCHGLKPGIATLGFSNQRPTAKTGVCEYDPSGSFGTLAIPCLPVHGFTMFYNMSMVGSLMLVASFCPIQTVQFTHGQS